MFSLDRFLAVHLHLRYQESVTHKRVVAVVMLIWLLSVFLLLIVLWVPFDVSTGLFLLILLVLDLLVIVGVYIRISSSSESYCASTTICTN